MGLLGNRLEKVFAEVRAGVCDEGLGGGGVFHERLPHPTYPRARSPRRGARRHGDGLATLQLVAAVLRLRVGGKYRIEWRAEYRTPDVAMSLAIF